LATDNTTKLYSQLQIQDQTLQSNAQTMKWYLT